MTTGFDIQTQMAELQQELAAKFNPAEAQRDPTIPAGTVLSHTETEGGGIREIKHRSMVRLGNQPLPERFEAWDVYGRSSLLPTAQMPRMLSKPNAERPGVLAFHLHRAGITRGNCPVCPPAREPFSGSCLWCAERTGGAVQKQFESEDARDRHYRAFHPDEHDALERRFTRELAREQMDLQRQQTEAMLALVQGRTADPVVVTPEAVAEAEPKAREGFICPECEFESTAAVGLAAHRRFKHGGK